MSVALQITKALVLCSTLHVTVSWPIIINLTWNIFTRENPINPIKDYSLLDVHRPLKLIVHGYLSNALLDEYIQMKDLYLKTENCVVVLLDWSDYNEIYTTAVYYTKKIGQLVGTELYDQYKYVGYNKIHILGHSLGAHLGGFAGARVTELTNYKEKIHRITGFDPALYSFQDCPPEDRLNKDDAIMVDVIHTDMGRLSIIEPIGTVDFYPNGGTSPQPGCDELSETRPYYFQEVATDLFCSHSICKWMYIASMKNSGILAIKCDSWENYNKGICDGNENILFGPNIPLEARGTYYFYTNPNLDDAAARAMII